MPRPYYLLAVQDNDGIWSPQFGDYDRSVVNAKRDDCYKRNQTPRVWPDQTLVIKLEDALQETCDAAIQKLNGGDDDEPCW